VECHSIKVSVLPQSAVQYCNLMAASSKVMVKLPLVYSNLQWRHIQNIQQQKVVGLKVQVALLLGKRHKLYNWIKDSVHSRAIKDGHEKKGHNGTNVSLQWVTLLTDLPSTCAVA